MLSRDNHFSLPQKRGAGILLPLFSLPNNTGIGGLGEEAYNFIDFLKKSGQSYWQMLPFGPTSYGDSPYQSFSSFAGNPYFLSPLSLYQKGLLSKEEYNSCIVSDNSRIDYGRLFLKRLPLLKKAAARFLETAGEEYSEFCNKNLYWLLDYSLFMVLKEKNGHRPWWEWPESEKDYTAAEKTEEIKSEMEIHKALQFLFFDEWQRLRDFANQNGINLIGDIPFYSAPDSSDVWANRMQFDLDNLGTPKNIAGCPPDAFSPSGQRWGNPVYNVENMWADGFSWWCKRLDFMREMVDIIRVDHFRAFESFYSIPSSSPDAKEGSWQKSFGYELFEKFIHTSPPTPIIAEDLGFITDEVKKLIDDFGFCGMKVLEFAFDGSDNEHLPHNYVKNIVAYTGTHDNDAVCGWMNTATKNKTEYAKKYLRLNFTEGYNWGFIKALLASAANIVIIPMQDILGLDSDARINTPSTVGENWTWRLKQGELSDRLAEKLMENMDIYKRS